MESIILYGIPNCDITKKAIGWLNKNKLDFKFHDYKKVGISEKKLAVWSKELSWDSLLNKRGTTWKSIPTEEQKTITGQKAAIHLMQQHTSLIKRPVVECNQKLLLGFDEAQYEKIFLK